MDIMDSKTRSHVMSKICATNTKPELKIRKALFSYGYRYRLHRKDLPGKPDIVLPKYNAIIFVHGCFWHGHNCELFRMPKTRPEFWKKKINSNLERDARVREDLLLRGWRILEIWECALRRRAQVELDTLVLGVCDWLASDKVSMHLRGRC